MDFLQHGSRPAGEREFGYDSLQLNLSPTVSRRRSASPLVSPATSYITPQLLIRNRQEPSFPQTDDEQLHLFHERIVWKQEKSLLPLAHDLADWMNSILGKYCYKLHAYIYLAMLRRLKTVSSHFSIRLVSFQLDGETAKWGFTIPVG